MPHNYKPKYLILNKTDVRQKRDDLLIEIFTTYRFSNILFAIVSCKIVFFKNGRQLDLLLNKDNINSVYTLHECTA